MKLSVALNDSVNYVFLIATEVLKFLSSLLIVPGQLLSE